MPSDRPGWDAYFLAGADWVATRADCTRSSVGAILVNAQREVRGTGYNGAPAGVPGCASSGACPRGAHYLAYAIEPMGDMCACDYPWPCPDAVAPNSDYSNCVADHAERNALRHAPADELAGSTLYTTRAPCPACWTLIRAARIARVVCPTARWTLRY